MRIICHGLKEEDFPVEFTDHKIMIGRDESNNLEVSADGVSRFHAILVEEGGDLFLRDNDSLNGTFLNYKPVSGQLKLVNGDIIQVGYRLVRVDFRSDEEVVLDFIPPEQTEIVSPDPTKPPMTVAVPEPDTEGTGRRTGETAGKRSVKKSRPQKRAACFFIVTVS